MYGLFLVEPEYSTLPRVDREYYVVQSGQEQQTHMLPSRVFFCACWLLCAEFSDSLCITDCICSFVRTEFYHEPLDRTGGNSIVEPSYPRGLDENADVVVFNGKESSLTTDCPLQAKTGEHVRIYFGQLRTRTTARGLLC